MSIEERVAVRDLAIPNYRDGDLYVYRKRVGSSQGP